MVDLIGHGRVITTKRMPYLVPTFCRLAGISRADYDELIDNHEIKFIQPDGRQRVPQTQLERIARGEIKLRGEVLNLPAKK